MCILSPAVHVARPPPRHTGVTLWRDWVVVLIDRTLFDLAPMTPLILETMIGEASAS
jgi:hypothetical protein